MALRNAADVPFFLIGGFNVLGSLTKVDDSLEAVIERSDTLGDAWAEHTYVGLRQAEITQEGFFDDAAGAVHDALSTGPGVSRVLSYAMEGTATGRRFIGWEGAMQVHYNRQVTRGELHKAQASYRNDGTVDVGKILRSLGPVSATGATTGSPVDNTVSSTGGAGYFQYTSGGESEVSIVHSSDNVTYAAVISFASATGARGAERKVTTGVIERYTAVSWTTGGVTGTTSFQFFVGLARGALSSA